MHTRTHHQLANIFFELEGDNAYNKTYFSAYHRMRAKDDPIAAANACDTGIDFLVSGRYLNKCQQRDGAWKASHRTGLTDWMRTEPPAAQGLFDIPEDFVGKRGTDHLIYRRRKVLG
tara:strand:- start:1504 stop:1854 length:351 start_codon:yes stop_codon:yes gene_type:complete